MSVHSGSVDAGGHAICTDEKACHVALVRKARGVCGVGEGDAFRDHFSRALKPALDKIGVWREASQFRESAHKLELAHLAYCGQFAKCQRR